MSTIRPSMEPANHLPQLSISERDRRWRAVREKMALRKLDCLLVWSSDIFFGMGIANFRYLTHCGVLGVGGYTIFPLEGSPVVFLGTPNSHMPYHACLGAQSWVEDIRPTPRMEALTTLLKEMGYERASIGLVGFKSTNIAESYTHRAYTELLDQLPYASISDQTALVEEVRLFKSEEEIGMLEESGRLARKCLDAMIDSAGIGVRECELWAEMFRTQVANGGEPHVFILLSSGNLDEEPGVLRRLVHGSAPPIAPTTRRLREGDLVITEFHASYGGYLTAAEFSVFVGDPPRALLDLHEIAVECLNEGFGSFRPGVTLRELLEAIRKPAARAGVDYVELGFHGHGLASPEFPAIVHKPNIDNGVAIRATGSRIGDLELKPGMVFGTNIDIHNPDWKPDVGIMLGDTVLVTENGPRRLVEVPTILPCVR